MCMEAAIEIVTKGMVFFLEIQYRHKYLYMYEYFPYEYTHTHPIFMNIFKKLD
jgi:hypothetical protein